MEIDKSSRAQNDESSDYWLKKAESGSIPDFLLRYGVCNLLHKLANTELAPGGDKYVEVDDFIKRYMRSCDEVALSTETANTQHYGLPPEFFELCLGDYLKYSCGYWQEMEFYEVSEAPSSSLLRDVITGTSGMTREFEKNRSIRQLLSQAEVNMLRVSLARAEVREKQNVLDLGCGWGAASIYMLENYTQVRVVAVSNSKKQADFILKQALDKKVSDRLLIITCNAADFDSNTYSKQIKDFMGKTKFDRIYSTEMFEHIRNWEKLLNKLTDEWLTEDGKIFLHFFAHKSRPYTYETNTWMGKHFFTGGIMPSHGLIKSLTNTIGNTLEIEAEYKVNGRHYAKTSEAWLKLFYQESRKILRIMQQVYGKDEGKIWFNRWKIFFLTVAEFFGMREGTEWFVSHYLLRRPKPQDQPVEQNIETK